MLSEGISIFKRFFYYLCWFIIITLFVYSGLRFRVYLGKEAEISFETKEIMFFNIVFPILVGIMLRLPKFFEEKKGKKKWRLDWIKIIVIAIPLLYILVLPYLSYTSYVDKLLFVKQVLLLGNTTIFLTGITGMVFGYVLIDSVKF